MAKKKEEEQVALARRNRCYLGETVYPVQYYIALAEYLYTCKRSNAICISINNTTDALMENKKSVDYNNLLVGEICQAYLINEKSFRWLIVRTLEEFDGDLNINRNDEMPRKTNDYTMMNRF